MTIARTSPAVVPSKGEPNGRESARLRLLRELNNGHISAFEPGRLFTAITAGLRRVLQHEYGQLYLYDPEIGQLRTRALYFPRGKGLVYEGMIVPLTGTPAGWVFENRRPMRIDRPDAVRPPNEIVERLLAEGVRSGCCVPLVFRDHPLGVLSVGSSKEAAFSQDDEALLGAVAARFGITVEREFVRRVCDGDIALFHELIRPYEREIYRIAYWVVRNPDDAEEVAQETLLKALARIHQLRSADHFGPWLLQIATNEARMRKRKYRRSLYDSFDAVQYESSPYTSLAERWADHRPIPSQIIDQDELRNTVADAVASLPTIYRDVCFMQHIEELPTTTTAALLHASVSAVKTRAHRARAKLRGPLQALSVAPFRSN